MTPRRQKKQRRRRARQRYSRKIQAALRELWPSEYINRLVWDERYALAGMKVELDEALARVRRNMKDFDLAAGLCEWLPR